ncbi:hypothetical protein RhiJN_24858 [Ceratobasidium sp. AG-Ba]|nr:hypothetical protein RhiJN_24858 [Ceratobasidium sp. AG-Ba]
MATKRTKVTHHISGRDECAIPFVVHHHTSSQPSQPPSHAHQKRRIVPKVVTFSTPGSLQDPSNTMAEPLPQESQYTCNNELAFDKAGLDIDNLPDSEKPSDPIEMETSRKTANLLLASWLAKCSEDYLMAMYNYESPPDSDLCDHCEHICDTIYRCTSCIGSPSHACASCLVLAHKRLPTHCIKRFEKGQDVWASASLKDLGYVLYLGHRGSACSANTNSSTILVGDRDSFVSVSVQYCTHEHAPSKPLQLLSAGLFACSEVHPRSAFTIQLLNTYNVFLTLGRTSAHKFYLVLVHLTKPGFPGDVKDRYRELMTTHRKYLHQLNLQQASYRFARHETDVYPGDQALDCVACPRPGLNFDWLEVPFIFFVNSVWFRVYFSYDGNFRSVRKSKKEPYREWTKEQTAPQRTEKPVCDHHKAGNDTSVRFAGRDVTGIGALTCTSHSYFVPQGMVDFFKGEQFIYADYAFASAVTHLSCRGPVAYGITYDIWCHWIVNFHKHAKNLPYVLTLPPDLDITGGIPKFHLPGHDVSCYVRYSLDNTQYVGWMEGEGPEGVWSHLNQHSGSTSEQGPGVHTNTINSLAYDWNWEKMIGMASHAKSKFKAAKKMYQQQKAVHDDLAAKLPHDQIVQWEATSLEPVRSANGKWSSPLMDPAWADGSFQSAVCEHTKHETSTARVPRRRPGATQWLADGIELEHNMRNIQEEAKEHSNPTPRQADSLNKQRINLCDRILRHQKQRAGLRGEFAGQDPNHPDLATPTDDKPEHSQLGLPSSFSKDSIASASLSTLAKLEVELRRGACEDALDSLRRLLGARDLAYKHKDANVRGHVQTTQAQAGLCAYSGKITKARWRYNNSRDAMIRLGAGGSVLDVYLVIKDSDLHSLKSYLQGTQI